VISDTRTGKFKLLVAVVVALVALDAKTVVGAPVEVEVEVEVELVCA